jgi:hypothetical protein
MNGIINKNTLRKFDTKNNIKALAQQTAEKVDRNNPEEVLEAYKQIKKMEVFLKKAKEELEPATLEHLKNGHEDEDIHFAKGSKFLRYNLDPVVQELEQKLDYRKKLIKLATEKGGTIKEKGQKPVHPVSLTYGKYKVVY